MCFFALILSFFLASVCKQKTWNAFSWGKDNMKNNVKVCFIELKLTVTHGSDIYLQVLMC